MCHRADGDEAWPLTWRKGRSQEHDTRGTHEGHAGQAAQTAENGSQTQEGLMRELAEEQGKLNHTYDTMETSGWKNRCSEGHGLRHAGGLHVARWPCVVQDKGDD